MSDKNYSNTELAQHYFSVAAQLTRDSTTYAILKKTVAESPVDISSFYREHGSLDALDVRGIGPKTKGILELILEKGVEEAKREIQEQKGRQIWQGIQRRVPRIVDDSAPSWDDIVKRYEGD